MPRKASTRRVPQNALQRLRRTVAYHEAGHAVVHFLLFEDIEFIEIDVSEDTFYETEGLWGRVRSIHNMQIYEVPTLLRSNRQQALALVARVAVNCLAGACVEGIVNPIETDWLDALAQATIEGGTGRNLDLVKAMRAIHYLYPQHNGRRLNHLHQMKRWTDELFAMPQIWSLTEALASRLETTDLLFGGLALSILDEAWGGFRATASAYSLGRKWRRRFGLRRQQHCVGSLISRW